SAPRPYSAGAGACGRASSAPALRPDSARMASRDGEHPGGGCPAMRAYLEGRSRQSAYPPNTIERLIESEIWIADERWILASPTWAEARSLIEHRGNV